MRAELEARLLCVLPSELIFIEGTSAPTRRLASCLAPGARVNNASAARFQEETEACAAIEPLCGGAELLPPLVVRALAHALDWLREFRLERVLELVDGFTELQPVRSMALSPNTLRYQ